MTCRKKAHVARGAILVIAVTGTIALKCSREASSGTTPPYLP